MAPTTSITIGYSKAGTLPPIFLAGSFSDPAWQPQEMEHIVNEDGEHEFRKEIEVEEGKEYQYKFRIGEGDWWILSEDSPTVTDDMGNRNNLLSVPKTKEPTNKMEHEKDISEVSTMEAKTLVNAEETKSEDPAVHILQTHQHEDAQITPAVEPTDPMLNANPAAEKTETEEIKELKEELQHSDLVHGEVNKESNQSQSNTLRPEVPVEPSPTPAVDLANPFPESVVKKEPNTDAKIENLSVPTLIVEKADMTPSHGNDVGPAATSVQKEAHDTHALDATPEYVLLRNQSHTPDYVTTAAEVADVAATLDREEPTPPISDDEAGRIGYRRMSHTPIPEVAATAAEVADVAASLDGSFLPLIIEPPVFDRLKEEAINSGRSTPADEKVPLFSHECCELPDHTEPCRHEPIEPLPEERPLVEDSSEEIDLDDPSIQMFPTERNEIFAKLREIQERLPEDETHIEGIPPSPVVGPNHRSNSSDRLHTPSPGMRAQERSSSLHSITEEAEQGDFLSLTDTSKTSGQELKSLNGIQEPASQEESMNKDSNGHVQVPAQIQDQPGLTREQPAPTAEQPSLSQPQSASAISEKENNVVQANLRRFLPTPPDTEPATHLEEKPRHQISQRHEVSLMSDGSADNNATMKLPEEQHKIEVQEVHPETPPSRSPTRSPNRQMAGIVEHTAPIVTPFVVGDRQLGQDEEFQNFSTGLGPSITVMPATPGASTTKIDKIPILDSAKTTAVPNDPIEARYRKQASPERPLTPSSMRSAGKDAKERNFLKAFWRVVFVDWIGGLIMKLCGGIRRRQKTLLAITAIVGFAVVPTLYFSEPARDIAQQAWTVASDTTLKYWQDWRSDFQRWLQL